MSGAAVAVVSRKVRDKARADRGDDARDARRGPRLGEGPLVRQGRPGEGRARSRTSPCARTAARRCPRAWRAASTRRSSTTRRTSPTRTAPTSRSSTSTPRPPQVKVRRFIAVDDCGVRINPMIVDGQIHGGLAEGVGIALMEVITFDEEGNCLNGSFMDYLIPTALECPDFELGETVTPCPHHPLGAKGVGESPNVGLAAGDRQRGDRRAARDATASTTSTCRAPRRASGPRCRGAPSRRSEHELEHLAPDVETLAQRLAAVDYLVDEGLATALFLSLRLPQPLLLEGEAGRRQDRGGQGARRGARHAADPAAVLRRDRRGRGALRVELSAPAAERSGSPTRNRTPLSEDDLFGPRLPDPRGRCCGRCEHPGPAAGGAADRRDRPRRRRLRGVPARAARPRPR